MKVVEVVAMMMDGWVGLKFKKCNNTLWKKLHGETHDVLLHF